MQKIRLKLSKMEMSVLTAYIKELMEYSQERLSEIEDLIMHETLKHLLLRIYRSYNSYRQYYTLNLSLSEASIILKNLDPLMKNSGIPYFNVIGITIHNEIHKQVNHIIAIIK